MLVEKGIPIPETRAKYPFKTMEVGESVLIADESVWARASNAAFMVGARGGKRFKTRKMSDGLRIWRIE